MNTRTAYPWPQDHARAILEAEMLGLGVPSAEDAQALAAAESHLVAEPVSEFQGDEKPILREGAGALVWALVGGVGLLLAIGGWHVVARWVL